MTRRGFAARLGVSEGAVSKWANERNEPDIGTLLRMASALHVSVDWLLGSPSADVPEPLPRSIDPRVVRRLIRKLRDVAEIADEIDKALPDEEKH